MGVHSLGEAKQTNNGYDGVFTPRHKEVLNTTYYENMLDSNLAWINQASSFFRFSSTEMLTY
jgi:hypothetical protein